MSNLTLNVRVSGPLSDFVSANVGADGNYENVSEYVRDLIRKDKERNERELFERLKAELGAAFSQSDDSYEVLCAEELIARNKRG
jgi:putative addiction module CopG family antidote